MTKEKFLRYHHLLAECNQLRAEVEASFSWIDRLENSFERWGGAFLLGMLVGMIVTFVALY